MKEKKRHKKCDLTRSTSLTGEDVVLKGVGLAHVRPKPVCGGWAACRCWRES